MTTLSLHLSSHCMSYVDQFLSLRTIGIMASNKKSRKGDHCLNCKIALTDQPNHCPNCGQKNDTRRLSVKEYIAESLGNFFSFDSKIISSLIPFFTRPGVVSRKYVDGERVKYVVPFRMYMFFSLVFFLVSGLVQNVSEWGDVVQINNDKLTATLDSIQLAQELDTLSTDTTAALNVQGDSIQEKEKLDLELDLGDGFKVEEAYLFAKKNPKMPTEQALTRLGVKPTPSNVKKYNLWTKLAREDNADFLRYMIDKAPLIIFLFIPIMALILKLFYVRRNIFYSEHLTFLFQTNSMVFLLGTISVLAFHYFEINSLHFALIVYTIYFFLAMKNFYNQSWGKTLVKFFLLGFFFLFALVLFVLAALAIVYYLY